MVVHFWGFPRRVSVSTIRITTIRMRMQVTGLAIVFQKKMKTLPLGKKLQTKKVLVSVV